MKPFLKHKVWPVVAGILVAFITMMIFEFINSFIYPLPVGLDTMDYHAVHVFTATLPWTAYILVILGWIFGALKAGYVTTYLSKEKTYRLSLIAGSILALLGIVNNLMIGAQIIFTILAIPIFIGFSYLGHTYFLKRRKSA